MDGLRQRTISFAYDYKVACQSCNGISTLTSDDYYQQINEAHIGCVHCGADIDFGPAAFAIRDAEDPALDDQWMCRAAWYHTTTDVDWPNGTHAMTTATDNPITWLLSADAQRRARERYETQALHLGTFEAAIESMLRRMRDQHEGGAQFYLYRVKLRDVLTVEEGWRDENHAVAAQITQPELGRLDAIRYLNVHEAPGSISLAVRRRAIAATQRVALPLTVSAPPTARDVISEVAQLRAQVRRMEDRRPATLDVIDQFRAQEARRRGIPFVRSPSPAQYALLDKIERLLEETYLPGVSHPVKDDFTRALQAWRRAQHADANVSDDAAYIRRFTALAACLADPNATLRELASQPIRELQPREP